MNTTMTPPLVANYHLVQPLRKKKNLMEVPNLLQTPECLHPLYVDIRNCRYVKSFEQRFSGSIVYLRLMFRDAENCNHVVENRIKYLFRKYRYVFTKHGDHAIVELKLEDV
ncbi:hypothetical protein [Flagellimonas marina]|uniref:Uncharacterized protein n=1 Tax=Flagellimonas marina TaxID=1775168 RepID=A0ABV8PFS9_9FLAO